MAPILYYTSFLLLTPRKGEYSKGVPREQRWALSLFFPVLLTPLIFNSACRVSGALVSWCFLGLSQVF